MLPRHVVGFAPGSHDALSEVAATLVRRPGAAALLKLGIDEPNSTPLTAAVAHILWARLATPEVFDAIAPYFAEGAANPLAALELPQSEPTSAPRERSGTDAATALIALKPLLDPNYLPAWEAGLLRTDVSWQMKRRLAIVVASFQDLEWAPVLGVAAVQAWLPPNTVPANAAVNQAFVREAVATLLDHPGRASFFALGFIFRDADRDALRALEREVGRRIRQRPRLAAELDRARADPLLDDIVQHLRDAVAASKTLDPDLALGVRPPTPGAAPPADRNAPAPPAR